MEDFLISANLEHLIPVFEDHNIDSILLLDFLSNDELKEIIKAAGDRAKLRQAIQKQASKNREEVPINILEESSCSDSANQEATEGDNEPPSAKKSRFETENTNQQPVLIVVNENPVPSSSNYSSSIGTLTCASSIYEATSSVASEEGSGSFSVDVCLKLDLPALLEDTAIGRSLLAKSRQKVDFNDKDRNILCDIVTSHFMNVKIVLNNRCFEILSQHIITLFPTEKSTSYYVRPVSKSHSKKHKSEVARGKIVDKYRNKLTALRKAHGRTVRGTPPSKIESGIIPIASQRETDSYIWLKRNTEPKNEVLLHWKNSYIKRMTIPDETTIVDVFNEWPILCSPLAPELVSYDFHQKYSSVNFTEERFLAFFTHVISKRLHLLHNDLDQRLYAQLEEELTTDSKNAIRLYLLPSLIPPKGRTRIHCRQHWKPTISESRNGMMVHVKTPADVEETKQQRVDFAFEKGLRLQPYIIVLGADLNNVTSALVVLNQNHYEVPTVLDALNFCFQAYHVFDLMYPFEAQHLWYLIQWNLYSIRNENDLSIPQVNDLI